jgi:hypothetical protein
MTTNVTATARHPYEADRGARRLYLAGHLALVIAFAAIAVAYGFVFALRLDTALWMAVLSLVLWWLSRWLWDRAWFSVAWAHQDGAAEPAWVTHLSRGMQLAIVVGLLVSGLVIGTGFSAALTVLISGAFAGYLIRQACLARRDGLAPRWRAWRIINAVTLTLTAVGIVVYLEVATRAAEPGTGLVLAICTVLSGVMIVVISIGFARPRLVSNTEVTSDQASPSLI